MNTELTPLTAIEGLRSVAASRAELIGEQKERYAEIDAEAKAAKERVRDEHREANRELIAAIRQAQTLGIHVEDSAKIVGMSPQALYRIESELKKWDKTHPPSNNGSEAA